MRAGFPRGEFEEWYYTLLQYDFNCNTEVFNNITLKGNLLNDTCTTAWFKLDRTGSTDISSQIRGLFSVASNRVEFTEGTYLFSEVDVNFPAAIKGLGSVTIKPVVKYPNVASALKRVFTVTNQSYLSWIISHL